ncbi:hypothetical protein RN001_006547 [Aquatica leii]|uniref:DDE Tnp4 domain-containing protein n=1 Tax=Aquatica leii TaxID=1421715 RepID=A0AAN7SQ92_9COLE|nr:hypothetical protein RN001_006547 [Aquatica leii]
MSLNFSIEELVIVSFILDEEDNIINARRKHQTRIRMWVHPSLLQRKTEGEYYTLYIYKIKLIKFLLLCFLLSGFLATGNSYKTIAFSYHLGHSTVQNIVIEVCTAINEILMLEFIPTPSREKWLQIANDMWRMWNFPNCLGALDGKHVINTPSNSGSLYFNYKKTFSIVLLALLDANYKFIAVDIGSYGKNSDGGILANSAFGKGLNNKTLNIPESYPLPGTNILTPYVILRDEAFLLKTYMMRPDACVDDDEKRIFNYRLCRARRLVECAFGILSQTFRVYCRRLIADPQNLTSIILTICILHNIIRNTRIINTESNVGNVNNRNNNMQNLRRQEGNAQREAFETRGVFKDFFNSV